MLVERDGEREVIEAALAGAREGHGRFVLLYGQSGIGRSSLLRASIAAAESDGAIVLEACGSELERGYGFGILRQLLEARIAALSADERDALLRHAGPAAEAALGNRTSEPRGSGAGFDQIEAVHRLIGRLATSAPLLLAVDDLQWCDRSSLDFLCFVGHRARQLPVTVIAAWRRGEPGVRAGRLQALASMPDTCFLNPAPLGRGGVRVVLVRQLGHDPGDEAVAAVHAQTGGQPLLVAELAAALHEGAVPVGPGCRGVIEIFTPEAVRRSVATRLGRHPEDVQRFARAVSVLVDGSVAHAAALAGVDRDAACRATDALVRAGVFRDDSTVAYAQPILQRAVYDSLSARERAELHQHAASLVVEAGVGAGAIDAARAATHLLACDPVGEPRFGDALCAAAELAAADGALADARQCYVRALGEVPDARRRANVLVRLAALELRCDELPSASGYAAQVLASTREPAQRAAASVIRAQALAGAAQWREANELLEAEARALHEGHPDLELGVRAASATLRACDVAAVSATPEALSAFADLPGDTVAERALLAACAWQMTLSGGVARHVAALCSRALQVSRDRGDELLGRGAHYLACRAAVLADAGELVECAVAREVAESPPATPRDPAECATALRAQLALSRGELAGAARAASEGLGALDALPCTALRRRVRSDLLATLILAETEQDHGEEAERALVELADLDSGSPILVCLQIAHALARSEPVAELAARAEAEPAGVVVLGGCPRSWAALAYDAAGDSSRARVLAAEHVEFARQWGGPSVLGRALAVRGVVDGGAGRIPFLEEAVAVLEDSEARLELARAAVELGSALRRAGNRRAARDELMRGGDLAHRCGADTLAARARAELVSTGARPRRAAFSGVGSLTLAERRVAMLAARGMTNREIAKELTVSIKTVSGQLGSVYLKLDVHDRSALAAAMRESDASRAEMEHVK